MLVRVHTMCLAYGVLFVVASTGRDGDGEMQQQLDTIFVQGLPQSITEQSLAAHFGAIGVIKVTSPVLQ